MKKLVRLAHPDRGLLVASPIGLAGSLREQSVLLFRAVATELAGRSRIGKALRRTAGEGSEGSGLAAAALAEAANPQRASYFLPFLPFLPFLLVPSL